MNLYRMPCARDCTGRKPGCHARCEKYNEWNREHTAARERANRRSAAEAEASRSTAAVCRKGRRS